MDILINHTITDTEALTDDVWAQGQGFKDYDDYLDCAYDRVSPEQQKIQEKWEY